MPKQYNIKWRIQDERELRRVARNFNSKLRRVIKKNPEYMNALPQFYNEKTEQFESTLSMGVLKELINTRQDYNRMINMLKRFSKRGAETLVVAPGNEYGAKVTKWQKEEMNRMKGIVNRRRKTRLENLNNLEMIDAVGKLGYTLGQRFGMGLASKNQLLPTKAFTPKQSQTDIKYKQRSLLKQSSTMYHQNRDNLLKKNYINELEKNYNKSDISDVISKIENMDSELFLLKFEARGDKFELTYPPDRGSTEYWNYVSELKAFWLRDFSMLDAGAPVITSLLK